MVSLGHGAAAGAPRGRGCPREPPVALALALGSRLCKASARRRGGARKQRPAPGGPSAAEDAEAPRSRDRDPTALPGAGGQRGSRGPRSGGTEGWATTETRHGLPGHRERATAPTSDWYRSQRAPSSPWGVGWSGGLEPKERRAQTPKPGSKGRPGAQPTGPELETRPHPSPTTREDERGVSRETHASGVRNQRSHGAHDRPEALSRVAPGTGQPRARLPSATHQARPPSQATLLHVSRLPRITRRESSRTERPREASSGPVPCPEMSRAYDPSPPPEVSHRAQGRSSPHRRHRGTRPWVWATSTEATRRAKHQARARRRERATIRRPRGAGPRPRGTDPTSAWTLAHPTDPRWPHSETPSLTWTPSSALICAFSR